MQNTWCEPCEDDGTEPLDGDWEFDRPRLERVDYNEGLAERGEWKGDAVYHHSVVAGCVVVMTFVFTQ